jgi:DNA-binding GntR family transcriptional regulator
MSQLLRDNVYEALRTSILSCALPPGEELRELDLAARYAVSRAPVREALQRLEQERLVTVAPRQGYRVTAIALDDARDLFDMRLILEPAAARAAASNAPLTALRMLDRFRARRPGVAFIDDNHDFHVALAEATGNRRLATTIRELVEQADRMVRISIAAAHMRDTSRLVAEHAAMIDALQARDGRGAARLMRAHIAAARGRILAALRRNAVVITAPTATGAA